MRLFLLGILLILCLFSLGQRSDGFFVQDYCFIDPHLLKKFEVDKFELTLFENNRKSGKLEFFLDSNQHLLKKITDYNDSISTILYKATTISQFACPIVKPDYIKQCESGRITKTENLGAFRITTFDITGKITYDCFKPGENLAEIKRYFIYSKSDLIDTIKLEDVREDGRIEKKELYIYNYDEDQLTSIRQLIKLINGDYQDSGLIQFKNFDCGLIKRMEGKVYYGQYKVKIDFKFYSKGLALK